jgi:hypothetical protein
MAIQARFKLFKSNTQSWETMSQQVADFLTTLGPGKVIGVSHSQESQLGVIAVWYWQVDGAGELGPTVNSN